MTTPTLSKTQLQAAAACIMDTSGLYENDRYGKLVPIYDYRGDIASAWSLVVFAYGKEVRMQVSSEIFCIYATSEPFDYRRDFHGMYRAVAEHKDAPLAITEAAVEAARRGWLGYDVQARVEAVIAEFEEASDAVTR